MGGEKSRGSVNLEDETLENGENLAVGSAEMVNRRASNPEAGDFFVVGSDELVLRVLEAFALVKDLDLLSPIAASI